MFLWVRHAFLLHVRANRTGSVNVNFDIREIKKLEGKVSQPPVIPLKSDNKVTVKTKNSVLKSSFYLFLYLGF